MNDFLDSDLAQASGWSTVGGAMFLGIMEWLGEMTVNDFLQGILLVGSIVFLFYKIKVARLDSKLKGRELTELNKKDNRNL